MAVWELKNELFDVHENIEINSGDETNIFHEPPPTQCESCDILKAVSAIGKYTDDINDPIACKMEVILDTFTRQLCLDATRTIKNSVLTNFFNRI